MADASLWRRHATSVTRQMQEKGVTEVTRVERAMHEFGVLNLYPRQLGDGHIAAARDATLTCLERERSNTDARRWRLACERVCEAARRLFQGQQELLRRVALQRGRTTRRTRCPIDVAALRSLIASPQGRETPRQSIVALPELSD